MLLNLTATIKLKQSDILMFQRELSEVTAHSYEWRLIDTFFEYHKITVTVYDLYPAQAEAFIQLMLRYNVAEFTMPA
jgi:hypothetical protein